MGFWGWAFLVILVCLALDIDLGALFTGLWYVIVGLFSLAFWVLVIMALFNLATL